jgi:predicted nuclease of predicted toxin-antitoxin system
VKLLFDQNLSPWLCRALADPFPDSVHVREVGLREADDTVIWAYASLHGFAIITKDAEALLRNRAADIEEFLADENKSLLAMS